MLAYFIPLQASCFENIRTIENDAHVILESLKILHEPGMVVYAFDSGTLDAEAGRSL